MPEDVPVGGRDERGTGMQQLKRFWAGLLRWVTYQPSRRYMRGGR